MLHTRLATRAANRAINARINVRAAALVRREARAAFLATTLAGHVLAEMRAWLADNEWADLDPADIADLAPVAVIASTDRHYAGGVYAFLADFAAHDAAEDAACTGLPAGQ